MKIDYVRDRENPEQCRIMLDGESWRVVNRTFFGSQNPFPSQVNSEDWADVFEEVEFRRAQLFAMRSLSKKDQRSEQIRAKLEERGVSQHNQQRLLADFQEKGYLDDVRWLENRVNALKNSKKGGRVIVQKLRFEGVSAEEAQASVQNLCFDEEERIADLIQGRYGKRNLQDRKERDKLIAALSRRGFSLGVVLKMIKKMSSLSTPNT